MNPKKKGNAWENKLANWLNDHGFKAWKDGASGGGNREKGDIGNNMGFTIESKACKTVKLMDWWGQVSTSASMHRNSPLLFVHVDGMPDNNWLVVMDSEDWIELVKGEDKREQTFTDPKAKYALQRARDSLREALKYLDA